VTLLVAVAASAGLAAGGAMLAAGLGAARLPAAAPLPPAGLAGGGTGAPVRGGIRQATGPAGLRPAAVPERATRPAWQPGLGPEQIRIPAVGVTAFIGAAATDAAGDLVPPVSPDIVGEWSGSAGLDAARGEVTLAGHVNWSGLGPFAFGALARLLPGDLVYTAGADGTQTAWRVTAVFALPKSRPLDRGAFAGRAGPRRLALITCGGGYDVATRSYDDNVYVLAVPAGRFRH
jgi:hypothetical protein